MYGALWLIVSLSLVATHHSSEASLLQNYFRQATLFEAGLFNKISDAANNVQKAADACLAASNAARQVSVVLTSQVNILEEELFRDAPLEEELFRDAPEAPS